MKKLMCVMALAAAAFCGCSKSDSNTLKMVTEASFAPYEFLDKGEVVGLDVEICRRVAERMGKKFEVENVTFDSVIPSVLSGKADIAAAGITVTEERKRNVDFSDVYAKTEIVIISKKSAPILTQDACKGKKVGVQSGNTAEGIVLDDLKQEPERFNSIAEACAALGSGRCDCVFADVDPARNAIYGKDDLQLAPAPLRREEYAIAIKKGRPELLKAINEVLAEMKAKGEIEKLAEDFRKQADALKM